MRLHREKRRENHLLAGLLLLSNGGPELERLEGDLRLVLANLESGERGLFNDIGCKRTGLGKLGARERFGVTK